MTFMMVMSGRACLVLVWQVFIFDELVMDFISSETTKPHHSGTHNIHIGQLTEVPCRQVIINYVYLLLMISMYIAVQRSLA